MSALNNLCLQLQEIHAIHKRKQNAEKSKIPQLTEDAKNFFKVLFQIYIFQIYLTDPI
jgi:hypothetical protein